LSLREALIQLEHARKFVRSKFNRHFNSLTRR
jgi:hypothetical protein